MSSSQPSVSLLDVLRASPIQPLPPSQRIAMLARMWSGLAAIEREPDAGRAEWRSVTDALNLMEALAEMGHAVDQSGLLDDATAAMCAALTRWQQSRVMRLDGAGLRAVRAVLEDYSAAVDTLPARVVMSACLRVTRRTRAVLRGQGRATDVLVVSAEA